MKGSKEEFLRKRKGTEMATETIVRIALIMIFLGLLMTIILSSNISRSAPVFSTLSDLLAGMVA